MQTIVMPERATGLVWLERYDDESGTPEKIALDHFPFVVGRSDTADLQINSNRVSREHAVLVHEDGEYRIRDLGSTNGTFVNGERIKEATLRHGDMLVVANLEFAFSCGLPESCQKTVTQLLDYDELADRERHSLDVRHEVRRLHEVLLCGCVENCYDAIVNLSEGATIGYLAHSGEEENACPADTERSALSSHWPVAAQLRQLARLRAVDDAAGGKVFVRVDPCDFHTPGLVDMIASLRRRQGDAAGLVVVVSHETIRDAAVMDELLCPLRDAGVAVALDGFTGNAAELPPSGQFDYLTLAAPLVRGIERNAERQRRVQAAVRAGREGHWQVIAAGIGTREELDVCAELGCQLGYGPLFTASQSAPTRRPGMRGLTDFRSKGI